MSLPKILPGYAFQPSPNQSHRTGTAPPSLLVVHYTGALGDMGSQRWLRMVESEASAHAIITRTGAVTLLVPLDRAAWHAGASEWKGERGVNRFSIGVELCNAGLLAKVPPSADKAQDKAPDEFILAGSRSERPYYGPPPVEATLALRDGSTVTGWWEPYAEEQLAALERLIEDLRTAGYVLELAGHDEIALPIGRKIDPGPAFPWARFR